MDGNKETHFKFLPFSGELALLGGARDAPSPAKKKSDACVGGIRVLEPESVLFLEIISLLPVLPVFMLYR